MTSKQWIAVIIVVIINVIVFASLVSYLLTSGEPPTPTPTRTPRPTFTPTPSRTPTPILMPTYPPTPTPAATPAAGTRAMTPSPGPTITLTP